LDKAGTGQPLTEVAAVPVELALTEVWDDYYQDTACRSNSGSVESTT